MQPLLDSGDVVFVTPLASVKPVEDKIPVVSSVLHCINLKRGDVVLISPDLKNEKSIFMSIIDYVTEFITFQRHSFFKKTNLVTQSNTVRRIVGLPGDTIYMKDCILYVKPKGETYSLTEFELSDIQYDIFIEGTDVTWSREIGFPGEMKTIILKNDEYFVLADNRSHGIDSRYYGPVRGRNIKGKLFLRYWPIKKISLF